MNKTEAIATLEFLLSCSYVDEFEPDEKEALKMGINALRELASYEDTIATLMKIVEENEVVRYDQKGSICNDL